MWRSLVLTGVILMVGLAGLWRSHGTTDPQDPPSIATASGASGARLRPAIPELPRLYVDTTPVPPSGRVIRVSGEGGLEAALNAVKRAVRLPAGGRLQSALDAAEPGDVIELEAGATFVGNYVLPPAKGDGWITLRSSVHERLPQPGGRVSPAYAGLMPKLVTPNARPALSTAPGARKVRIVGIEFGPAPGVFVYSVVELGAGEAPLAAQPANVIIDRCYVHGDPVVGSRRGIALNGSHLAVVDSFLADFKEVNADSQAIMGWNGPGPFKIVNNYLEGAGENVMFGGQDPRVTGLVPSDIEIRGNHFMKPLAWRQHDPTFAGIPWTVKNLFELKNARRVLVEGNVFEHNWAQTQHGLALVFTPRNQRGAGPWSVVEDVIVRRNIIRRATGGFFLLGWDNLRPSRQLRRVLIEDNLFADIGVFTETSLPDEGVLFLISDGPAEIVINHNTALQTGHPIRATTQLAGRWPADGFVFTNNVLLHNQGVSGAGTPGDTLRVFFPGAIFAGNVLAGGDPSLYPPGNYFPPRLDPARLSAFAAGDPEPVPSGLIRRAGTDGRLIGADLAAIAAAMPSWWRRP